MKARLLLRLPSETAASDLAKSIHDDPQRWLRIEQSDLPLFAAPPEINRQRADLVHIDATIRLFSPETNPEAIPPKRAYRRTRYSGAIALRRNCGARHRVRPNISLEQSELRKLESGGRPAGSATRCL